MDEARNSFRVLMGKALEKRPLENRDDAYGDDDDCHHHHYHHREIIQLWWMFVMYKVGTCE
jgi:hypothetical protein